MDAIQRGAKAVSRGKIETTKLIIEQYTFIDFAVVDKYEEGIISCYSHDILFTNIEVLNIGSSNFCVQHVLQEGDIVLLLNSKTQKSDLSTLQSGDKESSSPYSTLSFKAIPVGFKDLAKGSIVIDEEGNIKLETEKVTLTVEGDNIVIDNGSCNIEMTNKSVLINGHLEVMK